MQAFDTGVCSVNVDSIYLFGVHSPLVVDYEETIQRLQINAVPVCVDDADSRCVILESTISIEQVSTGGSYIACAFMPPRRIELASIAEKNQLQPADALLDPTAVIASTTEIAEGSYCNAGVTIGGMSNIGQHTVINRNASIGHHVLIDDFVSLGPSVTLSGGVVVGTQVMIGGGSVVLPGITIGDNAIVAAGSVVTSHVAADSMVAGVPAKQKKCGNVYKGVHIAGEE